MRLSREEGRVSDGADALQCPTYSVPEGVRQGLFRRQRGWLLLRRRRLIEVDKCFLLGRRESFLRAAPPGMGMQGLYDGT